MLQFKLIWLYLNRVYLSRKSKINQIIWQRSYLLYNFVNSNSDCIWTGWLHHACQTGISLRRICQGENGVFSFRTIQKCACSRDMLNYAGLRLLVAGQWIQQRSVYKQKVQIWTDTIWEADAQQLVWIFNTHKENELHGFNYWWYIKHNLWSLSCQSF